MQQTEDNDETAKFRVEFGGVLQPIEEKRKQGKVTLRVRETQQTQAKGLSDGAGVQGWDMGFSNLFRLVKIRLTVNSILYIYFWYFYLTKKPRLV